MVPSLSAQNLQCIKIGKDFMLSHGYIKRDFDVREWAAPQLGLTGAAVEDYIKAVRKADLAEKGDDDVFRKVKADLVEKGIAVTDTEIRGFMSEALAKAVGEIEGKK